MEVYTDMDADAERREGSPPTPVLAASSCAAAAAACAPSHLSGPPPLHERGLRVPLSDASNFRLVRPDSNVPSAAPRKNKYHAHFEGGEEDHKQNADGQQQQPRLKHARMHASSTAAAPLPPPLPSVPAPAAASSARSRVVAPLDASDDDGDDAASEYGGRASVMEDGGCEPIPAVDPRSCASSAPIPCAPAGQPIRLNVGGQLFDTTLQTLLSADGHTYFHARFAGAFRERASPFDGSFFIDRDPTHFRHVLNYLRTLELVVSDLDALGQLALEADFYGMAGLHRRVIDKMAEIKLERIGCEGTPPKQPAASALASAATDALQRAQHLRSHHHACATAGPRRNLFLHNWGTGGMAGAGATWIGAAPARAQLHAQVTSSPTLPARTHSCPSYGHASASPGHERHLRTPAHAHSQPLPSLIPGVPCTPLRAPPTPAAMPMRMQVHDDDEEEEELGEEAQDGLEEQEAAGSKPFVFSLDEDF